MTGQERRIMPRFYLVSRVDVLMAGGGDPAWGAVANISRTGVALYIQQQIKTRSKVTLRFRFQSDGGREVSEQVPATIVWQRGETAGVEFETPMRAGSPAALQYPHLAAHLAKKEATEGK